MSEALVVRNDDPITSSVHLVARNPVEMQNAQADLAVWLKNKVTEAKIEIGELGRALAEARTNGWSTSALTRQRNKAIGHFKFYEKLLAAVEAGYTIIPEFPIDVFAVRVTRMRPRGETRTTTGSWHLEPRRELPDVTGLGEGEYKNPVPLAHYGKYPAGVTNSGKEELFTRPTKFQEEVVFPLRAARPSVMNATAQAMALKVFDQIGICEPTSNAGAGIRRKGDPLIIGQILGQANGWSRKCASFIIAWHLDLRTL